MIDRATLDTLLAYPWPGNIRELENVIERGIIVSHNSRLILGDWLKKPSSAIRGSRTLADYEREHILEALELTEWQVSGKAGAATSLGLKPTTLRARMRKLGIEKKFTKSFRAVGYSP